MVRTCSDSTTWRIHTQLEPTITNYSTVITQRKGHVDRLALTPEWWQMEQNPSRRIVIRDGVSDCFVER